MLMVENSKRLVCGAVHVLLGYVLVADTICCVCSKYIPADPDKLETMSCEKVFVNVLASSEDEQGAIICCSDDSYTSSLCKPRVRNTVL